MARVLLVDDDSQALDSTRKILELAGHSVTVACDGQAALDEIRPSPGRAQSRFDLVLTDVRMPRLGGLEFLRAISLCGEQTPVILMTAFGRVEDAVWAMKLGAVDFLTKPFKRQALLTAVDAALKRAKARPKKSETEVADGSGLTSGAIIGDSPAIRQMRTWVAQVAPTSATVLLIGESGTGKELFARFIHRQSPRAAKPFVALNCAAIPEQLIESELFGFEKGTFTGATGAKEGLFEAAHGGTLFLDEIGDMPISLQAKLLRVLQEGEVRRLGATTPTKVDVRVIAATHKDLAQEVQTGKFRQDLLFRLEVITLSIPPLRERQGDISMLAYHFLTQACRRHSKDIAAISPETLALLEAYLWPGNVRELSNVIERAVVFATGDEITPEFLPGHIAKLSSVGADRPAGSLSLQGNAISIPLGTPLREVEELLIRKTLEATDGDKNMAARILGINSRTVYRKLDKQSESERPKE